MQQHTSDNNQFVVDLLTTLRKERFSFPAWAQFFARSWEMSCTTARTNPSLKRSWLHLTLLVSYLSLLIVVITLIIEGPNILLRLLPGFIFCVAWQQNDFFWHLGLNRRTDTRELLPYIGIANTLTALRGLCASFLLGRLIGGLSTSSTLALVFFLGGVLTDILDGPLARLTHTQSKLGKIVDSEADFCLYLALTLILVQNKVLAAWIGVIMLLRFCIPLIGALASYFLLAHQLRFGSTIWGKWAGLAQCLYFFALLAPPQLLFITRIINLPLLVITLALLILAPLAQLFANVRPSPA